jgi:hypothetical protein
VALLAFAVPLGAWSAENYAAYEPEALYPAPSGMAASPGDATYYVDPLRGNDASDGRKPSRAWKSMARLNAIKLAPGDHVVIAPGLHHASLKPAGRGSLAKPIVIEFLPGTHEFAAEGALRRPWFISNSCDSSAPKPAAILVENMRHVRLQGGGVDGKGKTRLLMGGRMAYLVNDHAEDVSYSGLVFDLKRPTVSEFRVVETGVSNAVIEVAEGSTWEIRGGKFGWTGDLGPGWVMVQQAIPETGKCWRMGRWDPFSGATAEALGANKVRLTYGSGTFGMVKGRQFQFRPTLRDLVGGHNNRSKDIVFRDCDFYALTGMGIVSQFTDTITFQRVRFAPPQGSLRTCSCWADALQFSGCKGEVLVESCLFSGLQDDAVNVHGTHLRIVSLGAGNQLQVRFMHPQTYGFAAFAPGDEVAVINHATLRELRDNPRRTVTAIAPLPGDTTGKDWLLTLDGAAPAFGPGDVVDNLTWYPQFTARSNSVTLASCRGFLITTRGKVLVRANVFNRCAMPAVLVEDDAEGWFESGPVRDMVLRDNRFVGCGVEINPHTSASQPEAPVHQNIRIEGNRFEDAGISARSVEGLAILDNRSAAGPLPVRTNGCVKVTMSGNQPLAQEAGIKTAAGKDGARL